MDFFNVNRILLESVAVIAAAVLIIAVPALHQPAAAEQPAAAAKILPQQPSLDNNLQDFADRMALDRRLQRLERQIQTSSNTAPTIVLQQPPIADHPQDFAGIELEQRLQRLERQIEAINMQMPILLNSRERAAQRLTEKFSRSWVRSKQATTKYRHRPRHEIDGTALAGETVDANPVARGGITNAFGCPASVPCKQGRTAQLTAPNAKPEYDEAGAEIK